MFYTAVLASSWFWMKPLGKETPDVGSGSEDRSRRRFSLGADELMMFNALAGTVFIGK